MKKLVIIPGGYHPYHAGHLALYNAAREAFPSADVYVAATADTSTRPFPFEIKQKLARLAGVPAHRFIQVKSPFRAEEITQHYDPSETQLIFVRSEKDRGNQPLPGGVKKDGTASYLQPYRRNGLEPMKQHGYMAYLPVVQFGPGMTSATEIRSKWPDMEPEQKIDLVKNLYPATANNDALVQVVIKMLDTVMPSTTQESLRGPAFGGAPVLLNPRTPADRAVKGTRMGVEFDEATLVNDPDAGVQIRPAGGMGTYDEAALVSNLARKFASMVDMVKNRNYANLHHVLYRAGAVQNMVRALAELEGFQAKQGRRPIARGREIDITDYVDER